jgi:hypothetical protein
MPSDPVPADLLARLEDVAAQLRGAQALDDESRHAVAELLTEMTKALQTSPPPSTEVTHLAECTTHLAESLRQQRDRGMLGKARDRLEKAIENAESQAPVTVGLARQFVDILAGLGI